MSDRRADGEGRHADGDDRRADGGSADAPAGVTLTDVRVDFDGITALHDVSLSVAQGEFFTLVGPSGCGKTTTLRAIAGFESPDSGTVHVGDRDVTDAPPEARGVGIVFQNYALFPHMSVRENVAYGLRFRDPPGGVSKRDRVDDLLSLVDMAGMGDRDPEALSGGQQQRVALARALAPGPDVLLLDEPLSALDARLRERLRLVIRDVQQELGITTVYVTHDQAEALAVSDRVAVVNDGRIEQVAPPETIYRDPASRFVAEFVGDNSLFEGEVVTLDPPTVSVGTTTLRLATDVGQDSGLGRDLRVGDPVTVSVRPEHVDVGDDYENTLPVTVQSVEFLGDAYRVHGDWEGREVLAKTDRRLPTGERVTLGFDPGAVNVVSDEERA